MECKSVRSALALCLLLTLGAAAQAFAQNKPEAAASQGSYSLGERLAPAKAAPAKVTAKGAPKEIAWEALIPKGWDPAAMFKGLDLSKMEDGDPRAMEALQRMQEAWKTAPVEPSMHGARIRIPGFVVPLETQRGRITEFLLVPYFGACIHSPPPPSNQTIHVFPLKPSKDVKMMDAVWISGTLETTDSETLFGNAGYRMKADSVRPYQEKK